MRLLAYGAGTSLTGRAGPVFPAALPALYTQ